MPIGEVHVIGPLSLHMRKNVENGNKVNPTFVKLRAIRTHKYNNDYSTYSQLVLGRITILKS